jgi:hypothetical protein
MVAKERFDNSRAIATNGTWMEQFRMFHSEGRTIGTFRLTGKIARQNSDLRKDSRTEIDELSEFSPFRCRRFRRHFRFCAVF